MRINDNRRQKTDFHCGMRNAERRIKAFQSAIRNPQSAFWRLSFTICFLLTAFCLLFFTSGSLAKGAQEPPLTEVVEKLQEKYRQTTTLTADFDQINQYKAVPQKQEARGKVWIKKPGLMRWDYARPEKNQIISDGKTLWIYTPAEKQVIKSRVAQTFGHTPQDFLMGLGDINQRFHISYANPPRNAQGFLMLNLVPREKEPTLSRIMLEVAPGDLEVKRFSLLDLYGNLTTLVFSNSKFDQDIPDSIFHFKVPPGVEVVSPLGGGKQ